MAWQLHYTSAEAGPTGRAGFQFTAWSAGMPDGVSALVSPYLTYRPPPSLPASPGPAQIEAMPAAFAFGPAGDRFALTQCRYLGQDYSGRFGNFLGHSIVAGEDELVGLRPIELWGAPIWARDPARPGAELPELTDLAPGPVLDPESLGAWLRANATTSYQRLAVILELARKALIDGHGRLVLVSADTEEIVRWIAVVSYSLPWELVKRLSFVTYSGDPSATAQTIVGTAPDVWLPSDLDATVIRLDQPPQPSQSGRFAATVTQLWREQNLDGIDELAAFGQADPETAAALIALTLSGAKLTPAEQEAVAGLTEGELPGWVWTGLGRQAHLLGHALAAATAANGPPEASEPATARCVLLALRDPSLPPPGRRLAHRYVAELSAAARTALTTADGFGHLVTLLRVADQAGCSLPVAEVEHAAARQVRDGADLVRELTRAPFGWRDPLLSGLVAGLEKSEPRRRDRLLTVDLCDLLADRDLRSAPRTGIAVVRVGFTAGRVGRVEATRHLVRHYQAAALLSDREQALTEIWRADPTADDCLQLIDDLGPALQNSPTLCELPGRAFVKYGLKARETRRVAERVLDARVPGLTAEDADAVLIAIGIADHRTVPPVAVAAERLTQLTAHASPALATQILTHAARSAAGFDPAFRTALLRKLSDRTLDWLLGAWLDGKLNRDGQAALLEIAIRLYLVHDEIEELRSWAHDLVHGWNRFTTLEGRFKKDRELAHGLRAFTRPTRRSRRGGH
ncbi:hypothetical protein Acor_20600 [Acrocarpospora corrugata]|uniref:Uncharacterized protein n=1 Tax=Acrocarpospora corrugata TaxID=35763 RepID=A0A5M3VT75_9ACTN|nr:hypothetical protein [Acrocarpospora corrugata]GER99996.1 hypothetical protein Acor_20600 [Acrocarpospora corrugata]